MDARSVPSFDLNLENIALEQDQGEELLRLKHDYSDQGVLGVDEDGDGGPDKEGIAAKKFGNSNAVGTGHKGYSAVGTGGHQGGSGAVGTGGQQGGSRTAGRPGAADSSEFKKSPCERVQG